MAGWIQKCGNFVTGDVKVGWGKGFEAGKPSCFEMFTLYERLVYIGTIEEWNGILRASLLIAPMKVPARITRQMRETQRERCDGLLIAHLAIALASTLCCHGLNTSRP